MSEKKSYSRYNERVITKLNLKKLSFQIVVDCDLTNDCRIKTSLKSITKNDFIDDCLQRGQTESDVLRNVVKVYYETINSLPHLRGKEFKEIKDFLCNNGNINK